MENLNMKSNVAMMENSEFEEKVDIDDLVLPSKLIDLAEIDLSSSGLDQTNLELSETRRFGLGLGKDKKWFLGVQYNLIKSATFSNEFFKRTNVF